MYKAHPHLHSEVRREMHLSILLLRIACIKYIQLEIIFPLHFECEFRWSERNTISNVCDDPSITLVANNKYKGPFDHLLL